MEFDNFKTLVEDARCTRRYNSDFRMKTQDIIDLIDLARISSSAKNMQPLKYIIVNDELMKTEIEKPLKWAAHLKDWNQSYDEKPSAYIIVVSDKNIDGFELIDLGISIQTIALGAKAKGFNSCNLASIDKEGYKKLFNLELHLMPILAIALGRSKENIKIVEPNNGDMNYYRDEHDTHCVPKRSIDEIILGCYE
ncbi:MAG: nitroreductase family protein [Campylobacterota bacterium]|nr:nitroreductase family protein [Campylobacterota bacterium]